MNGLHLLPAAAMGLGTILVLAAIRLSPSGEASLLVRVPAAPAAALMAAARADAALVAEPAPGFAVLHGDARRIRGAAGPAVIWNGVPPCGLRL